MLGYAAAYLKSDRSLAWACPGGQRQFGTATIWVPRENLLGCLDSCNFGNVDILDDCEFGSRGR
jgi:hypothetical protein